MYYQPNDLVQDKKMTFAFQIKQGRIRFTTAKNEINYCSLHFLRKQNMESCVLFCHINL